MARKTMGRILPWLPGTDESIIFQRQLLRDMAVNERFPTRGPDVFACYDPNSGKPLTRLELFDLYTLTMLVISEVEARTNQPPSGTHHV
jgi:hypothetical protein